MPVINGEEILLDRLRLARRRLQGNLRAAERSAKRNQYESIRVRSSGRASGLRLAIRLISRAIQDGKDAS